MNVNKKLGRFKQWAGERMGGEAKTSVSDDFKALEVEMGLRNEGMTLNHKAMSAYVKAISKRQEGDDKDKVMPVCHLGTNMVNHGEDFENDSEFGRCLIAMGRTNEKIGRFQEKYVAQATGTWLESLERSLAQMKEYQAARKKLESRRLAYDTAIAKIQKAKKEDFRVEEELRAQKAKYEESNEDVFRRMQDIQEAEADSVADLGDFLESELSYYAKCHEALLHLKKEWPARGLNDPNRRLARSRSNTAHSFTERYGTVDGGEEMPPLAPERPAIRSTRSTANSAQLSPTRELPDYGLGVRPHVQRSTTYDAPTSDPTYLGAQRMVRVPSDSLSIRTQKAQLRSGGRMQAGGEAFDDPSDSSGFYSTGTGSPDRYFGDRAASPASSVGSNVSSVGGRKAPPPPPPSRAKKPPPPPPPMKRSALSSSQLTYA